MYFGTLLRRGLAIQIMSALQKAWNPSSYFLIKKQTNKLWSDSDNYISLPQSNVYGEDETQSVLRIRSPVFRGIRFKHLFIVKVDLI